MNLDATLYDDAATMARRHVGAPRAPTRPSPHHERCTCAG